MTTAETLVLALGASVLVFAVLKTIFVFLGYLFPEADKVHRRQLDRAFDALDEHSLFELGQITLVRVLKPIESFFSIGWPAYATVAFLSFVQNAVVFTATASIVVASHFQNMSLGFGSILYSIWTVGVFKFSLMNALVATLGTAFDLLSLWITLQLIRKASIASRGNALARDLSIDAAIAIISCMWAYLMVSITLLTFYDGIAGEVRYWAGHEAGKYVARTLQDSLRVNPAIWYVVIGLGISAALPTLVYLCALVPVVLLRIVPRGLQAALSQLLYLLTTDKDPVLKQLSSFCTHTGALVAALIAWVKFSP